MFTLENCFFLKIKFIVFFLTEIIFFLIGIAFFDWNEFLNDFLNLFLQSPLSTLNLNFGGMFCLSISDFFTVLS